MKKSFTWTMSSNNRGKMSLTIQFGQMQQRFDISKIDELQELGKEILSCVDMAHAMRRLQKIESKKPFQPIAELAKEAK